MQLLLSCPTYPKFGQVRDLYGLDIRIWPNLGWVGLDIDRCINRQATKLFSQNGDTPLHLAVDGGHFEVVKQLLLSQANLDIENNVSSAISSVNTITLYFINRVELDWSLDRAVGLWVDGCGQ